MEVTIKGSPKEIAALVRSIQERQKVGLGDIELNTTGFFDNSKAGHTPELLQQQQLQQRK